MRLQSAEQIRLKSRRKIGAPGKEVANPKPRHAAECHLESAGPIDAERIRICLPPRKPLIHQFIGVDAITGHEPGLGERDQMLMTVQFPDDLVVADFMKIQKIDFEPWPQRAARAMNGIGMPIDVGAIVERFISK